MASAAQIVPHDGEEVFSVTRRQLAEMNEDQQTESNMEKLRGVGGATGLCELLQVDPSKGLDEDPAGPLDGGGLPRGPHAARVTAFGCNLFPQPPMKSWFKLFIESFNDPMLIVLIICAFVSLVVGIIEEPAKGWIEGTAILIAVLIVAAVTASNDYSKEKQFRKLNAQAEDVEVPVVRGGRDNVIPIGHLLVGDVVKVVDGAQLPADGVLLHADTPILCDESSLTGETDFVAKTSDRDAFLLSGCRVQKGNGRMLVLAVGAESRWGRIKARLQSEPAETPLQEKLEAMAKLIGYIGTAAAILTLVAILIIYAIPCPKACGGSTPVECPDLTCVATAAQCPQCAGGNATSPSVQCWDIRNLQLTGAVCRSNPDDCPEKKFTDSFVPCNHHEDESFFKYALEGFIIAVTVVVVAVPEGLPLAVTISLSFSTQKMLNDNNLIRILAACETMGNATNICSDKTGTLTENQMRVVRAWVAGSEYALGHRFSQTDFDPSLRELVVENAVLNSTATVKLDPANPDRVLKVVGSRTEMALCLLAENVGVAHEEFRRREKEERGRQVHQWGFTSARKMMSTLLETSEGKRLYVKGASEMVLSRCVSVASADGTGSEPLSDELREQLEGLILDMANGALRTLCLAHRNLAPEDAVETEGLAPEFDLTLDAIVGIQDPVRREVPDAVRTCKRAGIIVRMVTGDNINTAVSIAKQCGILRNGDVAMEGPDFRRLSPEQLDRLLPRLRVLARSAPEDKLLLVQRLNGRGLPKKAAEWADLHPEHTWDEHRELLLPGYDEEWRRSHKAGAVVGVTGDGTNDAPALKSADVGLSMGIAGTDVAKDASDIVILDDNFSSIVKAVKWGRSIYDNIRKFLQFQLTVNVVALAVTFIGAVSGFDPPLNAVMMLWVNLIMDTMGALALATEPPTDELLERNPYRRDATLVSRTMWRNIFVQSAYQLVLLLVLLFYGHTLFDLERSGRNSCVEKNADQVCIESDHTHYSIIFNAFVFCQLFNELNSRRLHNEKNMLSGIAKNWYFMGVIGATLLLQIFIIEVGGDFTRTHGLDWKQWLITIALGAVSLPLGFLQRFIPVHESPDSFATMPASRLAACDAELPRLMEEGVKMRIISGMTAEEEAGTVSAGGPAAGTPGRPGAYSTTKPSPVRVAVGSGEDDAASDEAGP